MGQMGIKYEYEGWTDIFWQYLPGGLLLLIFISYLAAPRNLLSYKAFPYLFSNNCQSAYYRQCTWSLVFFHELIR